MEKTDLEGEVATTDRIRPGKIHLASRCEANLMLTRDTASRDPRAVFPDSAKKR